MMQVRIRIWIWIRHGAVGWMDGWMLWFRDQERAGMRDSKRTFHQYRISISWIGRTSGEEMNVYPFVELKGEYVKYVFNYLS